MQEVIVVGSGMGALSCAALLAKKGMKPLILEQNWIPGGCTTSYRRKGFVFESGATTIVGLDENMPLRHLMDETGINLNARRLELPMQVHLSDGRTVNRYEHIDQWIREAEANFEGQQKKFWTKSYEVSRFVWSASTRFLHFPPAGPGDLYRLGRKAQPADLLTARYALRNTQAMMKKYRSESIDFQTFVDEQLLITAQNYSSEVNYLFGAAALCYTNYGNYYIDGGLINLVNPIVDYIQDKGGQIHYREGVEQILKQEDHYVVKTKSNTYKTRYLISGIPINNLSERSEDLVPERIQEKLMQPDKLYSAFQMGIGFIPHREFESLHHQIHLDEPLPETGSKSIFVSLSHSKDKKRSDQPGNRVASVSTHIRNPHVNVINTEKVEQAIVRILHKKGFIKTENIRYAHSSGPKSWAKWTGRAYGFVGGYPQYFHIKPWQMIEARLDGDKAYQCGDTSYPGQGIPGATLSGIIAAEKLTSDWL